jgi:hypothetical protein
VNPPDPEAAAAGLGAGGAANTAVGAGSGSFSVCSKEVKPDGCAGRSGAGISREAGAGEAESLAKVRNSSVNPPLPAAPESGAGAFSATSALSAEAILILSSSSGELSAPAPRTTLWTTGSAGGFGAGGAGLAGSGARYSGKKDSNPD